MNRRSAFWYTSVVVPLFVDQQTSKEVHVLFKSYLPVVWWAAQTEVHSALARLCRLDTLT
jgi:hypothetical protein